MPSLPQLPGSHRMYCSTPLLLLATALAQTAEPSAEDWAFFERKVRPVLVQRCQQCHSQQAKKQRGGLLLDQRAAILKGGDSGPAAVVHQPDKSLLVQAVRYDQARLHMPPTGKLPAQEIAVLEEWVRRGLPFPGGAGTLQPQQTVNLNEGRKFWSFQPPRVHTLPAVRETTWPQRRIDHFLLAEQEKRGLRPSPPASPAVLLRRLSFDLTGLPPRPQEVEAFTQSAIRNPQSAIEDVVDRLLASPHYGERWGRFWLDLARYCDVPEPWANLKGLPWLYRDWVVRALNENLPYDQFTRKQLAADLMPDAGSADHAALGFLGLSPVYWKELKLDPEVIKVVVAEEWEERIGAVTSTFLGLTVACARCHDHKFDPITTQDYYALAGVFASTRQAERTTLGLRSPVEQLGLPGFLPSSALETAFLASQSKNLLAPAVEDASLLVLPDGPHKTKLEYKVGAAQDVAMQVRGNPTSAGPTVPRRFLAVLSPEPPRSFTRGSGRLELAQALVTEGAPLASRVIVNRVWKQLFGAGLVETPSDFGAQGSRPSHPDLLDDLAARFMANGWSLKWLVREIVLSAAYQQQSEVRGQKSEVDADNRQLWRMSRRRLDIEAWRDAMLAVSGTLNLAVGGPPVDLGEAGNRRRTLYGTVKRRELHDLLRLHDFPDPTGHSAARVPTTTPLQQLFVLNSPFIQQQAAALAGRLKAETAGGVEARVQRAYQLLYGRRATEIQVRLAAEFLTPESDAAWQQYCQVLLGSNEFLFVD